MHESSSRVCDWGIPCSDRCQPNTILCRVFSCASLAFNLSLPLSRLLFVYRVSNIVGFYRALTIYVSCMLLRFQVAAVSIMIWQ